MYRHVPYFQLWLTVENS